MRTLSFLTKPPQNPQKLVRQTPKLLPQGQFRKRHQDKQPSDHINFKRRQILPGTETLLKWRLLSSHYLLLQLDYVVGFGRTFGRTGLAEARINKLHPLIKVDPNSRSNHKSTYYMNFPFFSTEVKCGTSGHVVADHQNGHIIHTASKAALSPRSPHHLHQINKNV